MNIAEFADLLSSELADFAGLLAESSRTDLAWDLVFAARRDLPRLARDYGAGSAIKGRS